MPAVHLTPVKPMMATAARSLPLGREWSYEVKWDGYRAQIVKDGARIALASRNLKDITGTFRGVAAAAKTLAARTAIVDGEVVALDASGRPSFQALHHSAMEGLAIVFYAFDLLHLNGTDLTRTPLDDRRGALARVVEGSGLLLSEPLPGTPPEITAAVRQLGLEGVVAKRRRSWYEAGRRSDAWVKVRFAQRQEFVVGGYKPSAAAFDSLVVGYYDGKSLLSAGKVRSGVTPHARALAVRATAAARGRAVSVREPADEQDEPLGRGDYARRDDRARLGEAERRRRDRVHRVDARRQPAARRVRGRPRRQAGARGAARGQRDIFSRLTLFSSTGVVPKFSSSMALVFLFTVTFVATDIVPLPSPSAFRCISITVNG